MKNLKKILLVGLATLVLVSCGKKKDEVKMGKADWDTGYFQAEIYKQALEKMGYKVSGPTVMKPQVFYVAAASGDVDLESADLLVSVGRGIEKEENIPIRIMSTDK